MLEVSGLRKAYSGSGAARTILDNIEFQVPERQFVSIIGASGSGKSTLLRCIAGLTEASGGTVLIDKRAVRGTPEEVVYVFQEYSRSLFPWRRLIRNVAYPIEEAVTKDEAAAQARAYIGKVGLAGFEAYYPWELSGGMQQRAAIARALVKQPKYLLMDEPFGALDAQTRNQLEDMLLGIWSSTALTVLFVTHDIDEAIYLSDRVLVLGSRPGRVIADIPIDLPRPRDQIESKENLRFSELRRQLFRLIITPAVENAT
ncbi:ABC transporter ATP-binding protein [Bradyrhizobium sp. dw_411]|uniref:ABC transporter ATP-binding protein n=1 Tax=Bradyrhizobium sp. dw_411 TaxID=2720082 RepID=UPI001BD0502F|nr:ABC transporter ATP-binding protein [Bradyrhizobium sp. dw_411]